MEKYTVGGFICALRKEKGMTQKELAAKLNVSDKAVSRWENGESCPDLMLIPVIAEIFEVTADELLRGERKTEENREKQTGFDGAKLLLTYKNKTAVVVAIAFFGLVLAFVINFAALNSFLAFGLAVMIFAVSAVCHTVFTNQAIFEADSSDKDSDSLLSCRQKIKSIALTVYCIIISALLFCIPLAVSGGASFGLDFMSWVYPGAAVTAVFCITVVVVRSAYLLKTKKYTYSDVQKANAKLKIKTAAVWCLAVGLTVVSIFAVNNSFTFAKGIRLQTQDEFVEFMKSYKTQDEGNGDETGEELEIPVINLESDTLFYYRDNKNVPIINFNRHNDGITAESFFPCTVYTEEAWLKGRAVVDRINIGFVIICIIEAVLPIPVYYRKKEKEKL